jgi:CRISPR/Cas system-associated exonuclease Cas4 (RecB family)
VSGSEYRSEETAARERVVVLEAELRDLEKIQPKSPPPDEAAAAEKRELRAKLKRIEHKRQFVWIAAALFIVTIARISLLHGQPNQGISGDAQLAIGCAVLVGFLLRIWSPKERGLEKKLRAIVAKEDEAEARFRVEAEPARKRVVEQELEEARALIEDEEEPAREKI